MFIDKDGNLYIGDMLTGDREATAQEVAAWESARTPTATQIIASKKQAVRTVREGILNRLAGIALSAYLSGDTATTAAYVTVRQGLLEITDNWPSDPDAIDGLVTNRYGALVAQCTPQMISAFAQVDA
jgi:hypothetical protein